MATITTAAQANKKQSATRKNINNGLSIQSDMA